jgi:flagellar hook-basal body complex protein FliE
MSNITDVTMQSHLKGLNLNLNKSDATQQSGSQFGDALMKSISAVNKAQVGADSAAEQIAAGETKNLHEAMIKLEEADISLRLMVQVRNKAVEAYQEIMRMTV